MGVRASTHAFTHHIKPATMSTAAARSASSRPSHTFRDGAVDVAGLEAGPKNQETHHWEKRCH